MPEVLVNLIILVVTIIASIVIEKLTPVIQAALNNNLVRES